MTLFSYQRDTNIKIHWASRHAVIYITAKGVTYFLHCLPVEVPFYLKKPFDFCFAVMIQTLNKMAFTNLISSGLDVRSGFLLAFHDENPILSERFLTFLSQILDSSFCPFIFHSFVEHFLFQSILLSVLFHHTLKAAVFFFSYVFIVLFILQSNFRCNCIRTTEIVCHITYRIPFWKTFYNYIHCFISQLYSWNHLSFQLAELKSSLTSSSTLFGLFYFTALLLGPSFISISRFNQFINICK